MSDITSTVERVTLMYDRTGVRGAAAFDVRLGLLLLAAACRSAPARPAAGNAGTAVLRVPATMAGPTVVTVTRATSHEDRDVVARRLGYAPTRTSVLVKAGCRTDVEVYISLSPMGIAPPPPMPGREVITTCE